MSYELQKPYTEQERLDFIVEYNHNKGLQIIETDKFLYALEANEIMLNGMPAIDPDYEEIQKQKERERLNLLSLTAADVERAIYKAKGIDFEDILEMVKDNPMIDLKALKIELKANNFYRGNPYVEQIGTLLGYTSEDIDYLFENGCLRHDTIFDEGA